MCHIFNHKLSKHKYRKFTGQTLTKDHNPIMFYLYGQVDLNLTLNLFRNNTEALALL